MLLSASQDALQCTPSLVQRLPVFVEGWGCGSWQCTLRVTQKCPTSNSDWIAIVDGPNTEMLRSNWLRECNKTSVERQHRLMCLQMQMNTWSYSCVPITLNLRSRRTGSSTRINGSFISIFSPIFETTGLRLDLRLCSKGKRNNLCSAVASSKCPQPLLLPEAVYGMSSTTRQSENSSVWVTLQCRRNQFNSLSLFAWIQISSLLTHFFLLPLPTPVSCSGGKKQQMSLTFAASGWRPQDQDP